MHLAKKPGLIIFVIYFRYWKFDTMCSKAFSRLNNPSVFSLSSQDVCSHWQLSLWPSTELAPVDISYCGSKSRPGSADTREVDCAWSRAMASLSPLAVLPFPKPGKLLALLAASCRADSWPAWTSSLYSGELLPSKLVFRLGSQDIFVGHI